MPNFMLGRTHLGRYRLAAPIGAGSSVSITYPLQPSGFTVIVYNSSGQKLAMFGDTIQDNPLTSIEFSYKETGCGDIKLTFAVMPSSVKITYNTRVDVHLYGDINPWYSGYITEVPKTGTTENTFVYKGYGYYSHLDNVIINRTYENIELASIVKDIVSNKVEPQTDIVYNASTIYSPGYTAKKLKFSYVTAKEALKTLAEYAGNYVCGVDETRQLYFKEVVATINEYSRFWVGDESGQMKEFTPEESIDDLKNHLYIKASSTYVTTLVTAIGTSDTTITVVNASRISKNDVIQIDDESMQVTNISGVTLTVTRGYNSTDAATHTAGTLVSDTSLSTSVTRILYECQDDASIATYGKRDDVLSLPSAMSEDDAQRWGDYQLSTLKGPTVTASAKNVNVRQRLIKAEGKARVTCRDGTVYELAIVKVTYNVSSQGMICNMELGALPTDNIDTVIAKLVRDQRTNELLSSYSSDEE